MYNVDLAKLDSKNILNADYEGKNILIRTCLNVEIDKTGMITDGTRIDESVPALKTLGEKANRVVMMAHLGRPTKPYEPQFSLEPVRIELEKKLNDKVVLVDTEAHIDSLLTSPQTNVKYFVLENIRFFGDEENKDLLTREKFAQKLAKLGEIFVNDAFADYRESASTYDIAKFLPSFLGPAFIKEVKAVTYFNNPARPLVAILGGAKLSEKLDALNSLARIADKVLVGGAMAYTLMMSDAKTVGKSLIEEEKKDIAKQTMDTYRDKIVLPLDHIVTSEFKEDSPAEIINEINIPEDKVAIDIGPKTQERFVTEIQNAKAILWNGPMGVYEWDSARQGTEKVGNAITANSQAYKFAGGGDSIAAINKLGLAGFNHISTGGGAMLAFVSYDKFPTLDIILNK